MKVIYTDSFARDLDAIADNIRPDNPARAISYVGELRQVCAGVVVVHPRIGRNRPEYGLDVRSFGTHDRTIFYRFRARPQLLIFLRIIGHQDLPKSSFNQ